MSDFIADFIADFSLPARAALPLVVLVSPLEHELRQPRTQGQVNLTITPAGPIPNTRSSSKSKRTPYFLHNPNHLSLAKIPISSISALSRASGIVIQKRNQHFIPC
jgi:hypothetical protein